MATLARLHHVPDWLARARPALGESEGTVAKAAEWLLDNEYLVARAARQIEKDLPPGFYACLRWSYTIVAKDTLDPCQFSLFSDQEGIIYEGRPVAGSGPRSGAPLHGGRLADPIREVGEPAGVPALEALCGSNRFFVQWTCRMSRDMQSIMPS